MDDEEIKRILEENLEISRQSLKILKRIRRNNRLAAAFKIIYWLIIVAGLAGALYFLEPYLQDISDLFQEVQEMQNVLKLK